MSDALLEAVRGLRVAEPELGFKPLLARLREQQPDLGAATKEVRVALAALKAESEAAKAAAAALPAAGEPEGGAPFNVALSLACIGCARLPSDMDDEREKHPICDMCRDEKLPTTYQCGVNCPANPGAWQLHGTFHKKVRKARKAREDGGAQQQRERKTAEELARRAEQTGDKYDELLAEGTRYTSKEDWRRAAKVWREAISLKPDRPAAYFNLGQALSQSGHDVEAAQWFLQAKGRLPVGSEDWAKATSQVFGMMMYRESTEVAKLEWWNDEELKALSVRVVRAAPSESAAHCMRAMVLCVQDGVWEAEPRSVAEFMEAAMHYEQAVALSSAPAVKAQMAKFACWCRSQAEAILVHLGCT